MLRLTVPLLVLAVAGCSAPVDVGIAPEQPLALELPDELGLWRATGEPEVYSGDELFTYMDGGADLYHEHGFRRLTAREYGQGDGLVSVEVYEMDGSAFGIYSCTRSHSGDPVELGRGGTLAGYYLTFWSGPVLVVVTAQSELDDAGAALVAIARTLEERLPTGGALPELMDELPEEGRVEGTRASIAGPISLANVAPLVGRIVSGPEEGASALYRSPDGTTSRLVVLRFSSPDAAGAALERAASAAVTELGATLAPGDDGRQVLTTDDGTVLEMLQEAALLRLTLSPAG